ncbi:MAG: LacI family DNA-binding transcriptional regulator [Chloroflexi bacterium]|nr:LacI family DNA-binding transcriptional regulator [Chloroflexota bacterium]
MTTIKDVAKHAGVSVTSASYALNGTGTIGDDTRKRVLQAAEELNYHPNAFARNLKKNKTHTIGVFISRFGGSFYEEILEGIHDTILSTDYELIVCPETHAMSKLLTQRQVDGAIVFDSKIKSDVILKLASKRFPIIILDRYLEKDNLLPLLLDNRLGTREAFYHLYEQGARRIGFVSGAADSFDNGERMRAFIGEAEKNQVAVRRYSGNFTEKSGYDAARLMIENRNIPEAVFCANDQMAIGLLKAMKEHGLQAPDDIAVVGFDDIQIARYMQPSLSTIGASRLAWGAAAAARLIAFLETEYTFPKPYRIQTRLIPRESSVKR